MYYFLPGEPCPHPGREGDTSNSPRAEGEYLFNHGEPVRSSMLTSRPDGSQVFCASAEDHFFASRGW